MERNQTSDQGERAGTAGTLIKGPLRGVARRYVRRFLEARCLPVFLAAAAILISLPALGGGLLTDDFVHRAKLLGGSQTPGYLPPAELVPQGSGRLRRVLSDLFIAVHPDENLQRLRTYGALPWWTYDGYRVAHWRPAASLTHWMDYRLFANSMGLMHLHSILWFAAVVFLVAVFYRRFASAPWIAGLAGVLYLLNDDAYFPTMWLANRNLLISLFFGIMALIVYDRWRRERWKGGAVAAPLCLLLSVLATEGGIATLAYLLAYEIVLGTGRRARRVLALVPSVAVILAWRLLYDLQGYGATGGGFYLDPVRQPMAYLVAVGKRVPFLLGGQWTTVPPELHIFLPPEGKVLLWCVLAVLAVLIPLGLRPLFHRHRRLGFWLLGMYGAVLPVCAAVPMSRALLFVAVGAFGLLAECLGAWLRDPDRQLRPSRPGRGVGVLLVVLLIAHLPLAVVTRIGVLKATAKMAKRLDKTTVIGLYARLYPYQDLVIVNAPSPASLAYDPFWAVCEGRSLPAGLRMLVPGYGPLEVVRTGPRRLVVRSMLNSLFDCRSGYRIDPVFFYRCLSDVRGPEYPMTAGDRFMLPRMTVDVLAVDERGYPSQVAFEFEAPLEARSLTWLSWDWRYRHFVVFRPPPVGQSVCLRGPF